MVDILDLAPELLFADVRTQQRLKVKPPNKELTTFPHSLRFNHISICNAFERPSHQQLQYSIKFH
jgi:hypothetical protein